MDVFFLLCTVLYYCCTTYCCCTSVSWDGWVELMFVGLYMGLWDFFFGIFSPLCRPRAGIVRRTTSNNEYCQRKEIPDTWYELIKFLIVMGSTDVRKGLFWSEARRTELLPTLECPQRELYSCASRAEAPEGTARQCPLPIDRPRS